MSALFIWENLTVNGKAGKLNVRMYTGGGYLMNNKAIGRFGEDIACEYLEGSGFEVIARNYNTRCGEIDVIAERRGMLHFIEVKTRTQNVFGQPIEAVTEFKMQRIIKSASLFIASERPDMNGYSFDVIEIGINHVKGVI